MKRKVTYVTHATLANVIYAPLIDLDNKKSANFLYRESLKNHCKKMGKTKESKVERHQKLRFKWKEKLNKKLFGNF